MIKYFYADTLIHNLDPRVKIIILALISISIFLITNPVILGIIFVALIIFWQVAHLPLKNMATYFKFLMGLFIFLIIVQALLYGGDTILIAPVVPEFVPLIGGIGRITLEGILFGVFVSARVLILVSLLPLVGMTTPVDKLALAISKMGVNYRMSYVITTAINLIPLFQVELAQIMDAQKLRAFQVFEEGRLMEKMKAYPALVVPMVIGAMRRAQLMGVAMDSRAFGAQQYRTYIEDIEMVTRDWVVLIIGSIATIGLVVVNYVW